MDPPGYVDVEKCEEEEDGAEDRGDDVLESRDPGGYFRKSLLGRKDGVCLGAVCLGAVRLGAVCLGAVRLGAVVGRDVGRRR